MTELLFTLVDPDSFGDVPAPAAPGARCQTCDYWERLEGTREARDTESGRSQKLSALMAGERLAGAYGMLAWHSGEDGDRLAIGWCQFGPISAYPRAQVIRDRYPELPASPAPWVVTCLQVVESQPDRQAAAEALLTAVCRDLDRRGIIAVEAYPEGVADPWLPSPGPLSVYERAGFARVAGEDRFPVMRRELGGEGSADVGWGDLLARAAPEDKGDDWPLPMPKGPTEDDLFRLPEKPKRPNPFGEDE
jgi:hypothetical protein